MATKKDYTAFVNMLADLTEKDEVKWVKFNEGNKLGFTTTFRSKILRIYEIHRPFTSILGLDFIDDSGASLWMFPVDVPDLMRAVKSKFVDIDNFISEALSEAGF